MATSASPYRRIGVNSWEELLNQVNDKLQNPPSGCDPIPTIDTPASPHRWAKSDVREVHDKLNEMPGDCFNFQEVPDLWKVSIIDDIESQLSNSWCDCEKPCCEPCSNAGDNVTQFLTTVNTNLACDDLGSNLCKPSGCEFDNLFAAAQTYRQNRNLWASSACNYCGCLDELDDLEDELADLEDAKDACPAGPSGDACRSALDPQIIAKQNEISSKETECDGFLSTRENAKSLMLLGKEQTFAAVEFCILHPDYPPCTDLLDNGEPSPITDDCENLQPQCCGCDPTDCKVEWNLLRRTRVTSGPLAGFVGNYSEVADGEYNPVDGTPVVFTWSAGCCIVPQFSCASTDCSSATCTNNFVYDFELILDYANDFPAFTCFEFQPCGSALT